MLTVRMRCSRSLAMVAVLLTCMAAGHAAAAPLDARTPPVENAPAPGIQASASAGKPGSQYNLGIAYLHGLGTPQDFAAARGWFEKASNQGHLHARIQLAHMLENGKGGPVDLAGALAWYRLVAEQGDGGAAERTGHLLRTGAGGQRDEAQARRWLDQAASQDQPDAEWQLALLDLAGGAPDVESARARLMRAAARSEAARLLLAELERRRASGRPTAMAALLSDWAAAATQGEGDAAMLQAFMSEWEVPGAVPPQAARAGLERAARKGHAAAMNLFGEFLERGFGGDADTAEGQRWRSQSAEAGYAEAKVVLARRFKNDEGKYRQLLREAADAGSAQACYMLAAELYYSDATREEGRRLLAIAADQGHAEAAYLLATPGVLGGYSGPTVSGEAGLRYLTLAASRGVSEAQRSLAHHYLEVKEPDKAIPWFERAAKQRDNQAALWLGGLYDAGREIPANPAAAARWYLWADSLGDSAGVQRLLHLVMADRAGVLPYPEILRAVDVTAGRKLASSHLILGVMHLRGHGVPRDQARGLQLLEQVAGTQDEGGAATEAMVALGQAYEHGAGLPHDDAKAAQWYQRAADRNWTPALLHLARFLREGRGMPKDVARAVQLLEKAANGMAEPNYVLGDMFERGDGVAVDLPRARDYFERAVADRWPGAQDRLDRYVTEGDQVRLLAGEPLRVRAKAGDPEAQYWLATKMLDIKQGVSEPEKALSLMVQAAEAGHAPAQLALAELLRKGVFGQRNGQWETFGQDQAGALRWYRSAAAQNVAEAQATLAWLLREGPHANPKEAFSWALKAAEAGHAAGQLAVSDMYAHGVGSATDAVAAERWALAAAHLGRTDGFTRVAELYAQGLGTPRDLTKARAWYLRAAEAGEGEAALRLGAMLLNGEGGPADPAAAVRWYEREANDGDSASAFALAKMYLEGPLVIRSEAQALRWYMTGLQKVQDDEGDPADHYGRDAFAGLVRKYPLAVSAKIALAGRLERGEGLARDTAEALQWYERAADDAEDVPATALIAHLKAAELMMATAAGDSAEEISVHYAAVAELIDDLSQNPFHSIDRVGEDWAFDRAFGPAVVALHTAARAGYVPAQHQLGWLYAKGRGLPRNDARAAAWSKRAREAGYIPALMAEAHRLGELEPDEAKSLAALKRCRQAAKGVLAHEAKSAPMDELWAPRRPPAQYRQALEALLAALEAGKAARTIEAKRERNIIRITIVPDTPATPAELAAFARSNGIPLAQANAFLEGRRLVARADMAKTVPERLKWLEEAVKFGNTDAMLRIGGLLETGQGMKAERIQALAWYMRAESHGDERAAGAVSRLAAKLTRPQVAQAQELATAWWEKQLGRKLAP